MGNSNFKDQMISESQKQGNSVSTSELNQGIDVLGSFFSFLTWGAVISLILAIIGGILISKTQNCRYLTNYCRFNRINV